MKAMRKIFLALACGLFFMACKDDGGQEIDTKAGEITFEISAAANSTTSRNELYGEKPILQVSNVKVYAFQNDGNGNYLYKKTFDITGWTAGMTFQRYTVSNSDLLPVGDYMFLSVGRNSTDIYTITAPTASTKFEDMQASINAVGDEEDIYSGNTQVNITSDGARVNIDMKRKVAGVLGYFKNVPQEINGTTVRYLRLSVTNANRAVSLSTGAGVPITTSSYNIIDIDLSTQTVSNGVYTGNDLSSKNVIKLANTQLDGRYIIPVSGVQLTLGLYDANNNPVKTWNVHNAGNTTFDIMANNMYALGQKMDPGSVDNKTPDPTDDDNPIDLLVNQEITVTIIPAWDVINNLTIQ